MVYVFSRVRDKDRAQVTASLRKQYGTDLWKMYDFTDPAQLKHENQKTLHYSFGLKKCPWVEEKSDYWSIM